MNYELSFDLSVPCDSGYHISRDRRIAYNRFVSNFMLNRGFYHDMELNSLEHDSNGSFVVAPKPIRCSIKVRTDLSIEDVLDTLDGLRHCCNVRELE